MRVSIIIGRVPGSDVRDALSLTISTPKCRTFLFVYPKRRGPDRFKQVWNNGVGLEMLEHIGDWVIKFVKKKEFCKIFGMRYLRVRC